jgi:hypothetical protein
VAYGAQAIGFWLKNNWVLCYILLGILRIGLAIRRSCETTGDSRRVTGGERFLKELRIVAFFAVMAMLWYLVWSFLAPSIYVSYRRFFAHSYEYIWNSQLYDFDRMAKAWPYVLLGYPLSLLLRIAWGIRRAIRKRLGF